MVSGARTTHPSFEFLLFWFGFFFSNVIGLGSKPTEVSGEVPVDCTEFWARFMEINALIFIINYIGSQAC